MFADSTSTSDPSVIPLLCTSPIIDRPDLDCSFNQDLHVHSDVLFENVSIHDYEMRII